MKSVLYAVLGGVVASAAAWIDPLFMPLVLIGPVVTGVIGGLKGMRWRLVALVWAVAGIGMVVSDWIVNQEDVMFHVVLTGVMVGLASLGYLPGRFVRRRRTPSPA